MDQNGVNNLNELLTMLGMDPTVVFTALAAGAAFVSVIMAGRGFMAYDKLTPRIKALKERRQELKDRLISSKDERKKYTESMSLMQKVVNHFKLNKSPESSQISQLLISAGIRNRDAVTVYLFVMLIGPFVGGGLGLLITPPEMITQSSWKALVPLLMAFTGYKLPYLFVSHIRSKRWKSIQKGIPDGLDLMMVCAEAGLTLGASIDRVSTQLRMPYPELADELALTSIELGFLPERKMALDNLYARVALPDIKGITSVLIQTEKYGTPVAKALRTLALEFRQQRLLRAEQKAARLPAIMTIPMIVCILPCLFIVILTPAVLQIMDEMLK